MVITTLADDAPDHIRAIFDRCIFHDYPPTKISDTSIYSNNEYSSGSQPSDDNGSCPSDAEDSHDYDANAYTTNDAPDTNESYHDKSPSHHHYHSPYEDSLEAFAHQDHLTPSGHPHQYTDYETSSHHYFEDDPHDANGDHDTPNDAPSHDNYSDY